MHGSQSAEDSNQHNNTRQMNRHWLRSSKHWYVTATAVWPPKVGRCAPRAGVCTCTLARSIGEARHAAVGALSGALHRCWLRRTPTLSHMKCEASFVRSFAELGFA